MGILAQPLETFPLEFNFEKKPFTVVIGFQVKFIHKKLAVTILDTILDEAFGSNFSYR